MSEIQHMNQAITEIDIYDDGSTLRIIRHLIDAALIAFITYYRKNIWDTFYFFLKSIISFPNKSGSKVVLTIQKQHIDQNYQEYCLMNVAKFCHYFIKSIFIQGYYIKINLK